MRRRTKHTINQPVEPLTLIPVLVAQGEGAAEFEPLLDRAIRWAEEGASWLHVVLPSDKAGTLAWLPRLADALSESGTALQVAAPWSGVHGLDRALELGADRVVVELSPIGADDLVQETLAHHGTERVVVAVGDATRLDGVNTLKTLGVERLLVRVERDASGPRIAALGEFAQKTGLRVIAECDIHTREELRQIRWVQPFGVEGILLGRALEEGRFSLAEASAVLEDALPQDARTR